MKIAACLIALVSLVVSAHAETYSSTQQFSKTYPMSATGSVRLANVNGSVEITTWDKNEVLVEADKRARNPEDLERIRIEVESSADRLVISTIHEKTSSIFGRSVQGEVRYHVKVPVGVTLEKISSVNSSIVVKGVRGATTLHTVNGPIRASGLGGDANLETVNGSISAKFDSLSSTQKIEAESVNGACTISLPEGAGANIYLASVNGSARCEFPITIEKSSRHTLRGTIGNGAIALKASTVNGSVRIEKS